MSPLLHLRLASEQTRKTEMKPKLRDIQKNLYKTNPNLYF
ncbi:hypothetical protein PLAN_MP20033 [Planktothrix rubescens CCAP 1459/22]|uniref:Uncharacterized protein n=1 Tax=Planktothrix rubescens CCAP 1459/22 TaxID=329571 RepID=A0A6J7ZE22_PLARU|nr:hypothetical protein PLAN_MP20033 [Planktothrix rubescens NIVA-CYA 18]